MFPSDWYWLAEDGRIYSSARQQLVKADDEQYVNWSENNGPTNWPRDDAGNQTAAALHEVVGAYGYSVPDYAPVPTSVSSAQAKIQLLRSPPLKGGKTLLDDVTAAAQEAGGEVYIWFTDARDWERANANVNALGKSLGLTDAQIDEMYIEAKKINT